MVDRTRLFSNISPIFVQTACDRLLTRDYNLIRLTGIVKLIEVYQTSLTVFSFMKPMMALYSTS